MKISEIRLQNFRCFDRFNLELGESFTVVIGKNGSGKSNLLAALTKGLSFMFARDYRYEGMTLPGDSFIKKASFNLFDARRDAHSGEFNYPVSIQMNASIHGQPMQWEMYIGSQNGKVKSSLYKHAFQSMVETYNDRKSKMPVLAFFGDSYPHRTKSISTYARKIIGARDIIPRNFAFYDWDSNANCSDIWQKRYINVYRRINDFKIGIQPLQKDIQRIKDNLAPENSVADPDANQLRELESREKLLGEVLKLQSELAFVDRHLISFTKDTGQLLPADPEFTLSELVVNSPEGLPAKLDFLFANLTSSYYESLPMGYKRILSIVFEIAYRHYILNGDSEPEGIVIIDEIELHLHPSLANSIVDRLRNTFPGVQFIVTTHSPQIITSLKKEEGMKLVSLKATKSGIESVDEGNYYGADYETTLTELMGAKLRSSIIGNMLDSYRTFKRLNMPEEAEEIRKQIIGYTGPGNRYVEAELAKP